MPMSRGEDNREVGEVIWGSNILNKVLDSGKSDISSLPFFRFLRHVDVTSAVMS
ncbi:hypothetical protein [Archaeoglobus sp.]